MKRRLMQASLISFLVVGLLSLSVLGQRRDDRGRNRRDRDRYVQTVYCESGDMKRHWCREGIGRSVRLVRQRSDARCVRGRTWGVDRSGIWVDRGCRADFEVQ